MIPLGPQLDLAVVPWHPRHNHLPSTIWRVARGVDGRRGRCTCSFFIIAIWSRFHRSHFRSRECLNQSLLIEPCTASPGQRPCRMPLPTDPCPPNHRQMQQCSGSGGALDWTSGQEYFSAQQQPAFSFQGQQEQESCWSLDVQVSESCVMCFGGEREGEEEKNGGGRDGRVLQIEGLT